MCQVDSFLCGCAPLRKGALIIGSIKLVMMLMMLLVTIISRMIPLEESEMTNYKFPGFLSLLWWQWWWWVWCQWRWSDSGGDPNSLGWGDALRTAPRSQQGRFPSTSSFPLSYMIWYDFFSAIKPSTQTWIMHAEPYLLIFFLLPGKGWGYK